MKQENSSQTSFRRTRDVVVVNKPQGMVVHPSSGSYQWDPSMRSYTHVKDLQGSPGIASGSFIGSIKTRQASLMIAKNDQASRRLSR